MLVYIHIPTLSLMNKAISTLFSLSVLPLAFQIPATAITLEFTPSDQEINLGSQVNVDLAISGLGAGTLPSLSAFDIDIAFDSSIIAFNNAVFGDQLDFGFGSITNTMLSGDLNLLEVSLELPGDLNNLQAADFLLATVTFDTVDTGKSSLAFSEVELLEAPLPSPNFPFPIPNNLNAELKSGSITVTRETAIVPESSNLPALLVLGTVGILLHHQKK